MTIQQIITKVDRFNPNEYTNEEKIDWLNDLEWTIKKDIIDTHENPNNYSFNGFNEETPLSTELIAIEPYSKLYRHYLDMQIYLNNQEINKYNTSAALFNSAYTEYASYYNRVYMPISNTTDFSY